MEKLEFNANHILAKNSPYIGLKWPVSSCDPRNMRKFNKTRLFSG